MRRVATTVAICLACVFSTEAVAFANPTPDPSMTSTPVYIDGGSQNFEYGFAVLAFLLAALVVMAMAQLVRGRA